MVTDPGLIAKLKQLWDGNAEYVLLGPKMYRVMTPNGPDDPMFKDEEGGVDTNAYGSTSTGFAKAPEPPSPKRSSIATAKKPKSPTSDVG